MKIGLYFGSFNPIHNGHLIIANYVLNYAKIDQVWFVVSPQNPLKRSNSLLNEHHRKNLIDLCIEGESSLRSSNVEFKLPKPSYTIDTLTYLEELYPKYEFAIIMGSDSFSNIRKWKNHELLVQNYEIYIYKRIGYEIESNLPKIHVMDAPLLEISSTYIRDLIKQSKSIRFLLPDIAKEEIQRQNYYRTLKKNSKEQA
ncbi:MAG: nicotinate (nicotinamide) nucleotide adenylyltransferase [Ginsengibacter sp.]